MFELFIIVAAVCILWWFFSKGSEISEVKKIEQDKIKVSDCCEKALSRLIPDKQLPSLKGSEKQIAWVESMRANLLMTLDAGLSIDEWDEYYDVPQTEALHDLLNIKSCRIFIEKYKESNRRAREFLKKELKLNEVPTARLSSQVE